MHIKEKYYNSNSTVEAVRCFRIGNRQLCGYNRAMNLGVSNAALKHPKLCDYKAQILQQITSFANWADSHNALNFYDSHTLHSCTVCSKSLADLVILCALLRM